MLDKWGDGQFDSGIPSSKQTGPKSGDILKNPDNPKRLFAKPAFFECTDFRFPSAYIVEPLPDGESQPIPAKLTAKGITTLAPCFKAGALEKAFSLSERTYRLEGNRWAPIPKKDVVLKESNDSDGVAVEVIIGGKPKPAVRLVLHEISTNDAKGVVAFPQAIFTVGDKEKGVIVMEITTKDGNSELVPARLASPSYTLEPNPHFTLDSLLPKPAPSIAPPDGKGNLDGRRKTIALAVGIALAALAGGAAAVKATGCNIASDPQNGTEQTEDLSIPHLSEH